LLAFTACGGYTGGVEHARWVFDYDPETWMDDEAGYRFGAYKFALGEFVAREDRLIEINASSMRLRAEIVRVGGSKGLAPT
jgi:hypothetical protein